MLKVMRAGFDPSSRDLADDAGMTLVEMLVASAIALILMTLLTTSVTVFAKADTSTVNSANAAANVRLALLQLQHDIQSANPLGTLSTVAAYNDELQLTIQPSNIVVTWQYNTSNMRLTRQAGAAGSVVELTGVTNGVVLPVFSYYDHCAINQVTQAQATPSSISGDTTVVQITLSVANLNSAPYGTTTRVNIMNQPPGASQCG
jgi:prepilin-type N-terminal cleavage/methylation domain-containing protein